jgi:hypothetical protein
MPRFFELRGVFMAQPIADVGACIIAVTMLRMQLKKIPHTDMRDDDAETVSN